MSKMIATLICCKKPLKIVFSGTKEAIAIGLDMQYWGTWAQIFDSLKLWKNDNLWLTLNFLQKGQIC